jgi:thiol-disulfide isomerase/thioredoxin
MGIANFYDSKALLVAFWCNHCPYVQHIREGFVAFAREYQGLGLAIVVISANDVSTHPDDSPELMKIEAEQHGFIFPYLFDETQARLSGPVRLQPPGQQRSRNRQ